MQIQYLGFQLKAHGRDYTYRVINKQAEDREFVFSISNRAFAETRLPFQDAAALCYQKLQNALDLETAEHPLPTVPPFPTRNSMPTARHIAPLGNAPGRLLRARKPRPLLRPCRASAFWTAQRAAAGTSFFPKLTHLDRHQRCPFPAMR